MKARIKKDVLDFKENDIIDILGIDTVEDGVNVHFLADNKYYKCYFDSNDEVNEYLEFNYKELIEELERGVSRDYNPHELALMQLKINELIRKVNKIKEE